MTREGKAPRFPFAGALLCAACVGAAAWTWMRYSYCWENPVFPDALDQGQWPDDAFARMRVKASDCPRDHLLWFLLPGEEAESVHEGRILGADVGPAVLVRLDAEPTFVRPDTRSFSVPESGILMTRLTSWTAPMHIACRVDVRDTGGVVVGPRPDNKGRPLLCILLDTTASRFTGASIAGLVVGAMGVFIFGSALKAWLRERRAFRAGD